MLLAPAYHSPPEPAGAHPCYREPSKSRKCWLYRERRLCTNCCRYCCSCCGYCRHRGCNVVRRRRGLRVAGLQRHREVLPCHYLEKQQVCLYSRPQVRNVVLSCEQCLLHPINREVCKHPVYISRLDYEAGVEFCSLPFLICEQSSLDEAAKLLC